MSWVNVAVIGGSLIAGAVSGGGKDGAQSGSNTPGYYDPYAQYRGGAAQKLNDMMNNYNSADNPVYESMLQAAQRQAASQGYNGSGNALVAAANAGGQAYQQQFNNLAMLSGAEQSPAQAGALAAQQGNYNTQMNQQMWGGMGSLFGRLGGSLLGGTGGAGAGDNPTGW
jgi:hypothetical protein